MIRFCKFLQDNENKRQRAERRYLDEVKAREAKEREILEHKNEFNKQKRYAEKIEKKVAALKKYDEYLAQVIAANQDQYQDINDLTQRYKTLEMSNKNLEQDQQKREADLERLRNETSKVDKEKTNQILLLNNEIAGLQQRAEMLESRRNEITANLEGTTKNTFDENVYIGRIFMAIDN